MYNSNNKKNNKKNLNHKKQQIKTNYDYLRNLKHPTTTKIDNFNKIYYKIEIATNLDIIFIPILNQLILYKIKYIAKKKVNLYPYLGIQN
jgi:hypothetical protein